MDDLIGLIRDRDGPTVQSIVNTIRSGADLGLIRDMLTRILEEDIGQPGSSSSGARDSNVNLVIHSNQPMGNNFNPQPR